MSPNSAERNEKSYLRERRDARCRAVQFLYQVDAGRDTELDAESLDRFWLQGQQEDEDEIPAADAGVTVRVRELADRLVHGVIDKCPELDRAITECTENWRVERMSIIDRNILRLAAYELLFCEEIPPKATVNEAIELAKRFGDKDSPRFVNGIVDKLYHTHRGQGGE